MAQVEGYIRFNLTHEDGEAPSFEKIKELNDLRTKLHDIGVIGMNDEGYGLGNVSIRDPENGNVLISGTQTGAHRVLEPKHYARVLSFDIEKNSLHSLGPTKASSETLSHGAVYITNSRVNCVVHAHSMAVYTYMLENGYPKTSAEAEGGTVGIAREVQQLVEKNRSDKGNLVMEGHVEGFIVYGPDIASVDTIITELCELAGLNSAK